MSAIALKSIPDVPVVPPGEDELPYDFGPPMESDVHLAQMLLLIEVLRMHFAGRRDVHVGGNMAIYYSELQVKKNDFRGPDFFVVLNTVARKRKSWVVWQEERTPDVVIELLSDSTERVDRGDKMRIYAKAMRVPEYYLFDPLDGRLEAYHLDQSTLTYQKVELDPDGELWSEVLGLRLCVREGRYQDMDNAWLRWAHPDGTLLPTGEELARAAVTRAEEQARRAEEETRRAEEEARRAEEEARRASQAEAERDRLLAMLKVAGLDPNAKG